MTSPHVIKMMSYIETLTKPISVLYKYKGQG
jgi:hypothetical protein